MKHVLSSDGTPIAYERSGDGPAVILVGGLVDRTENMPLAQALAEHFAAAAGLPIEVSYGITDGPEQWRQYIRALEGLIADGCRGDAFALFMRTAGAPQRDIESARRSPAWPSLEAVAHTLVYGAACLGDGQPPRERLAQITCPTLVLSGTELDPHMSELPPGVFQRTATAIAEAVPAARLQTLAGQNHMVEANVLAPVLDSFFLQ